MFGNRPAPRHAATKAQAVCTECAGRNGEPKPVRSADDHAALTGHRITYVTR